MGCGDAVSSNDINIRTILGMTFGKLKVTYVPLTETDVMELENKLPSNCIVESILHRNGLYIEIFLVREYVKGKVSTVLLYVVQEDYSYEIKGTSGSKETQKNLAGKVNRILGWKKT